MTNTLICLAAPLLLIALLICEKRGITQFKIAFKFTLSALFILLAGLQTPLDAAYTGAVLSALALCLVGDVCLAIPGLRAFRIGLVAFLLGHVGYIIAFATLARPGTAMGVTALLAIPLSTLVYLRLRPFLNGMRRPVLGYVVVITLMVIAAGTLFGDRAWPYTGRLLVLNGALAFYISDLFVARQRFVHQAFFNRLIGLPLYYLGQFQLAYTVGLMG
ncbi:MAG: lysoplasmalogenase [Desulfobacterales bacterium]|nr:lysoplasmalogenase [Desulfobacterales bacterium]